MFESVNKDTKLNCLKRAIKLLLAWEECSTVMFSENFIPGLHSFMYRATR